MDATTTATETTARCARCNRPLRSARALRTGYGPTCYTMVRAAAREVAAQHKAHQVAKATELLEDGGVVPSTRAGVYYTVGSEGEVYKTARTGCTCPAGLRGKYTCYHRIAVEVLEAVRQATPSLSVVREPLALGLAA